MKKLIALIAFVGFAVLPVAAQQYATVTAKRANVRSCAGTKCSIKWHAWRYTPVIIMQTNEDKTWAQIKDFEGFNGWISMDLLSTSVGGYSAKVDVNVRQGASAGTDIVCTVEKGYPFKYLARKGDWIQVVDEPENPKDGTCKGWIYGKNLWGFTK